MYGDHTIFVEEYDDGTDDRIGWECSCGRGGSYSSYASPQEDKHVPVGESIVYISRPF